MSIKVTDFKWEKGKNDLEYIALLEKTLDAMKYKFGECAKVAKEQYNKGRESAFKEIAYSDDVKKEEFEILAYNKALDDFMTEIERNQFPKEYCVNHHIDWAIDVSVTRNIKEQLKEQNNEQI